MLGGMICYVDNDLALMYTLDGLLYMLGILCFAYSDL